MGKKKMIVIYCGQDGTAARAESMRRRDDETTTTLACGFQFDGQPEPCELAVIMPDLPTFRREFIAEAYNHRVEFVEFEGEPAGSFAAPPEIAQIFAEQIFAENEPDDAHKVEYHLGGIFAAKEPGAEKPKPKRGRPKLTDEQRAERKAKMAQAREVKIVEIDGERSVIVETTNPCP